MRLIDADVIIKALDDALDEAREDGANLMDVLKMELFKNFNKQIISHTPSVDAEPTYEQVIEYCRKRCLIIVTGELFNEMKARLSEETVKHGQWELSPFDGNWTCSKCGNKPYHDNMKNMNYCPNCGAKMNDERITDEDNSRK